MENNLILKEIETFNKSWWSEFISNTEDHSTHQLVSEALSDYEVNILRSLAEKILKKISKEKKRQYYLRLWDEGKYNKDIYTFFNENPIDEDESIFDWKKKVFGEKKIGMFLNFAETHDEELLNLLTKYIKPYTQEFGIPMNGISTTIVLGDYGWTPLGIHRDALGEYIIHLHLGPGRKDMYIWNKDKSDKYNYVHGNNVNNFDDFIQDYSSKSTLSKGDIFSMAGKNVHIGNSNEFSIGLILEFNRPTEQNFLQKLWFKLGEELFDKNFSGNKAKIISPYNKNEPEKCTSFLLKGVKNYNFNTDRTIKDALQNVFLDHKYTLLSNEGFSNPPFIDLKKIKNKFEKINLESSIQLYNPYKILFYQRNDFVFLFIRGRKIKIRNHINMLPFISYINENKIIKIVEIKDQFFNDWDNNTIFKFLYLIYKYKGIKIQHSEIAISHIN
jgi:hypothetical protein